ncbi:MAG: LamG-like jellyroll fold domain-containing protein [Pseudobdellovibrionaceae bacterium]
MNKVIYLIIFIAFLSGCGARKEKPEVSGIDAKVDAATSLVSATGPVAADGSAALSVSIELKDAAGVAVAGVVPRISVTGSNNSIGTCTASDVSGLSNCSVTSTTAQTKSISMSYPVTVAGPDVVFTAGAASKICSQTQPGAGTAGAALATQPVFFIGDSGCNLISSSTASVTVAISSGTGSLNGTTTVSAIAGVVTFTDLSMTVAGVKRLTASSAGLTSLQSNNFTVNPAAATALVYTTQPGGGSAASVWSTQPVLEVRDTYGNRVTDSSAGVVVALTTGTGTLSGTVSVSASSGVVTFTNLRLNLVGTNKVLTATSAGLSSAVSNAFTITNGAPSQLVFTSQPTSATAGMNFASQPVVEIRDSAGNVVPTSASVTLTAANGTLLGTSTVSAVNGVVTFSGLSLTVAGSNSLSVASAGLSTVTGNTFTVNPGNPALPAVVTAAPLSVQANGTAKANIVVAVKDVYGNPASGFTVQVVSSRGATDTLTAVNSVTDSSGTANFEIRSSTAGVASLTISVPSVPVTLRSGFEVQFVAVAPLAEYRSHLAENATTQGLIPGSNATTTSLWIDLFNLGPYDFSLTNFSFDASTSGWCGSGSGAVTNCSNGAYRLLFDGVNDYAASTDFLSSAADRTIDVWHRPNNTPSAGRIIVGDEDVAGKGLSIKQSWASDRRIEIKVGSNKSTPEAIRSLLPLAYWRLDDVSGAAVAVDGGVNGTPAGTMTYSQSGTLAATNDGRSSILFNGTTGHFSMNNNFEGSADFTVSAWVRPTTVTGLRPIVSKMLTSGFFNGYSLELNGTSARFRLINSANTTHQAVGSTVLAINNWYHIVGVRDSAAGRVRIYVNGVLDGTGALAGTAATTAGTFYIARNNANYFQGQIDEVAVYNYALTDPQVASISSSATIPVCYSTTQMNNGTWYHTAASFSSTADQIKLYMNGTLECTRVVSAALTINGSTDVMALGANLNSSGVPQSGSYYSGAIAEVRFWNSVLSDAQVTAVRGLSSAKYP